MNRRIVRRTALELLFILALSLVACQQEGGNGGQSDTAERRLEKLRSVPYTTVGKEVTGSEDSGVVLHDPALAYQGYNLYCSRIRPEVRLMDMTGEIVHLWSYPPDSAAVWDHAVLLEDGDVVIIQKFKRLMRLDRRSEPLWRLPLEAHHDVAPLPDGTFYTIVREVREHRGLKVRFSAIVRLSSDGSEVERWSTYDHLGELHRALDRTSFLDTVLDSLMAADASAMSDEKLHRRPPLRKYSRGNKVYDYFHLNTISPIPETPLAGDPRFVPGNLLVCFRNVNQIAILGGEPREVLWAWGESHLEWPHHPTMLSNGRILVFDNGVERRSSRVLELDPITGKIEWQYSGEPPTSFYTFEKGSVQRLPNGNTLISEGNEGRVFEITRPGEIVWEWLNPETMRNRRVQIYRMERIPPRLVEPLLKDSPQRPAATP
jgi:hypothetical protein